VIDETQSYTYGCTIQAIMHRRPVSRVMLCVPLQKRARWQKLGVLINS
jgi:hypothetical protein